MLWGDLFYFILLYRNYEWTFRNDDRFFLSLTLRPCLGGENGMKKNGMERNVKNNL